MKKVRNMSDQSQEYLTFMLDGEEFGVDILRVQEIMVWSPVTAIPGAPDYLRGVINLRGVIVPIVDMRQRFGRTPIDYETGVVVGVVVDAVSEVYKVEAENIKNSPNFGDHIDSRFVYGMATVDEKIIILLDAKKLLNVNDLYNVVSNVRPQVSNTMAS
jgi:purine-binding chemotaxis protein CheW